METKTIERSIWINAPREQVWRAVTEPEQIPQWFLPAIPGAQMNRDDSGKLSVRMGPSDIGFAVFEGMDAPRRMTTRGLPDRLLATTYTLDEENDGTRVTVTMTGFEALPEDARQDRLNFSGTGWERALENLKAYLDGAELPHPYASVASLFGYVREPKSKIAVERSIWINASRERVWRAITDPEQVEKWFSPGTQWGGTGLEAGGRMFVVNAETGDEMYVQVIDVVDPPNRLVTHSAPEESQASHVTDWTLAEENSGTRLTITYIGYELETEDVRWINMEQNAFGFGMMLENLKAVVEGTPLPHPQGF